MVVAMFAGFDVPDPERVCREFLDDPSRLDKPVTVVANGSRGIRHIRAAHPYASLCGSFSQRSSFMASPMTIEQARQGDCCNECVTRHVTVVSHGGDQDVADALRAVFVVEHMSRAAARAASAIDLLGVRVEAQEWRSDIDALVSRNAVSGRPMAALMAARSRLEALEAEISARVSSASADLHQQAIDELLRPTGAPEWVLTAHEAELLAIGPDEPGPLMVHEALYPWADSAIAGQDATTRRQRAVGALLMRGLRRLEQVTALPPDQVNAALALTGTEPAFTGSATLEALKRVWEACARETANAMVDRWEERFKALEAMTGLCDVALATEARWFPSPFLELAVAASSSMHVVRGDWRFDVVTLTRAAHEYLASTTSRPGTTPASAYAALLPADLDSRVLDTALGLWEPFEVGEFTEFDAALRSAAALVNAPRRPVTLGPRKAAPRSRA